MERKRRRRGISLPCPLAVLGWFFSFVGIINLDSVVTYDRIIRAGLSLLAIAAYARLIAQLAAPILKKR